MERSSQVILRNASRLGRGALLLVNPPSDGLSRNLQNAGHTVHVSSQDFGDFRWQSDSGIPAKFEVYPEPLSPCGTVILNLPREKDRLAMMLDALSSWMPQEARLWLVGENAAGIKSAGKHLAACFQELTHLDNARHCGLYEARQPLDQKPFQLVDYEQCWPVTYAGKNFEVVSLPGVFAHGRLDKGSQLLLKCLESLEPRGKILDFACGSGVLASALLVSDPDAELTLLDVSALAIESSRSTLQRNGLKADLLPSDGLSELSGKYDWIISNPPFHRGVSNDLEIASRFFGEAGTFLTGRGRIVIVCNRHLPYANSLRNHFEQVDRIDENAEFVVMRACKPKR
jgi:16S rRNA (guanine1207-N2)-methyltransferase